MKELFELLAKTGVSPNGFFTLHCVQNSYSYPNYINMQTELYRLTITGFLEEVVEEGKPKTYTLTTKGLHLIADYERMLHKVKPLKSQKMPFSEWEEKIVLFNNKFPKGKKPGTAMSFKTTPKELYDRFKWFFQEYPEYTWDDVMTATDRYVRSFEDQNDFSYMQLSKYFIKKDDKNKTTTSTLAGICFNIAEGDTEDINTGFHYFGP